MYRDYEGNVCCRSVSSRVPQGSVLGLFLWNVTFVTVLNAKTMSGSFINCFGDDIIIVITAPSVEWASLSIRQTLRSRKSLL